MSEVFAILEEEWSEFIRGEVEMGKSLQIDVSIIIANYNAGVILKDCVASLINYSNNFTYEIIVIDNNSTQPAVDDMLLQFSNIRLIRNSSNKGFASANNQGIKIAKGEYILLLNNDTIFFENSILRCLEFVREMKEDVIIGCKLLNKDLTLQESHVFFDSIWNCFTENFFLYKIFKKSKIFNKYYLNYAECGEPVEVDSVKGAFFMSSSRVFKELGGLDERFYFYMEETDFCYRFKKRGGRVFYYPLTSLIHLGGATADKVLWFKFKNQSIAKIQFYQKNFNGLKFLLCTSFHYMGVMVRIPVYFLMGLALFNRVTLLKSYYYFKQLFHYPHNVFN